MNFYITLNVIPDGDGYRIEADTNLPEEGLVEKVLRDAVETFDRRESAGFQDE